MIVVDEACRENHIKNSPSIYSPSRVVWNGVLKLSIIAPLSSNPMQDFEKNNCEKNRKIIKKLFL